MCNDYRLKVEASAILEEIATSAHCKRRNDVRLAAFTAVLGAQASEGTGTGVSDCVLGSTARDISGSNPSRSATN
jgi:hypothetical protein